MMEKGIKANHPIWLWTISALLAMAGCVCLPLMIPFGGKELIFTNSIFSAAVFAVLLFLLQKALKVLWAGEGRTWLIAGCLSFFFSACMAFGAGLEEAENVVFTDGRMWIGILVWGMIVTLLVGLTWHRIKNHAGRGKTSKNKKVLSKWTDKWEKVSDFQQMIYMTVFILLCWFPVFLAVYPGFFVYDAQDEYMQVVTRTFTNHHPLIHVLFLGGTIQAVYKISGSYNLGIACYTIIQMGILSVIFSYAIVFLRQRKVSLWIRVMTLFYIGVFPVMVMFSLCSSKDGLFTGFFLLLFLMVKEICERPFLFFSSKRKQILFIIGAAGVMLLRHNGRYAFWVFAILLLFYCRQQRKKLLFLMAASMGIYLAFSSGLSLILGAKEGGRQEMLTVPIQQMARVYHSDKENINSSDLKILYEVIPADTLEHYVPKISDGVKIGFNNQAFEREPMKYLKLWGKWGISHPFTYLNAWFMTSYGFWYPDTVIDVYRGNRVFTYTYEDSSYFGYEVEQPGVRESKIPWLDEHYRRLSLEITQQRIPVVSMLFSPGFLFWVFIFTLGYLLEQKKYRQLIPYLLPLLIWLTVIWGPTYLVRYVVFLWVLVPWMCLSLFGRSGGG